MSTTQLIEDLHEIGDEISALATRVRLAIANKDIAIMAELDTSKLDALAPRIDTVAGMIEGTVDGDVAAAVEKAKAAAAIDKAIAVAQAKRDQVATDQDQVDASTVLLDASVTNLEAQAAKAAAAMPHPDQGLPDETPGAPDQGLPGEPGAPDQALPGEPAAPDQSLPGMEPTPTPQ